MSEDTDRDRAELATLITLVEADHHPQSLTAEQRAEHEARIAVLKLQIAAAEQAEK